MGVDELQEVSLEVERTGQGFLEGEGEVDFSSWLEGEEAGTFPRFLQFRVWQEGVEEEGCALRDG